jgi:hypothetical protein
MKRKGRDVRSGRLWPLFGNDTRATHSRENFGNGPVGSVLAVGANEFPNLIEVE